MTDEADVLAHIATLETPRREEAERLDTIFREVTGYLPRLWSGRMVGYGTYDYTYKSGRSGTWFGTGFAAGKRHLTIYILPGYTDFPEITAALGPDTHGKSCIYITKLDRIDEAALGRLIRAGLDDLSTHWPVQPT